MSQRDLPFSRYCFHLIFQAPGTKRSRLSKTNILFDPVVDKFYFYVLEYTFNRTFSLYKLKSIDHYAKDGGEELYQGVML